MTYEHPEDGPAMQFDALAAAIFGGAAGLATLALAGSPLGAAAGSLGAAVTAFFALQRISPTPAFAVAAFEVPAIEPDELLLTLADRCSTDELLLEDRLAPAPVDPGVVRLFDYGPMASPGQLHERIQRHLRVASRTPEPPAAKPDDSGALLEALARLRSSLR